MSDQPISFSPDFRRNPKTMFMCCVCYRDIKNPSKAVAVTVDWGNWTLLEGHDRNAEFPNFPSKEIGNEYVGADCWKKTRKMTFLTTQDVAAELEVTVRTVERWRESGYFSPDKRTPGGHSRYSKEQVCQLKLKRQLEAMML